MQKLHDLRPGNNTGGLIHKKYVLFLCSSLNYQSLFVLMNPGSAVGKLNDGGRVGTHLLHLDPLGNLTTHDKSSIYQNNNDPNGQIVV